MNKVRLSPSQEADVHLSITPKDLSYFDVEARAFVVPTGNYELVIAFNAIQVHRHITINVPNAFIWKTKAQS